MSEQTHKAVLDLAKGVRLWPVWLALATTDIKLRYRRTLVGPLWLPIASLVTTALLGLVFSTLFSMDVRAYFPYLAAGLSIWFFIATTLSDSVTLLVQAKGVAQQIKFPVSFHIFRRVATNSVLFLHNFLSFVAIALFVRVSVTPALVTVLPAALMLLFFAIWVSFILSIVCLRYRDLGPIMGIVLGLLPLITPIYYRSEMLAQHRWLYLLNPLHHLIHIMRAPLIGEPISLYSWTVVIVLNIVGASVAFALFVRFRRRIPYWM